MNLRLFAERAQLLLRILDQYRSRSAPQREMLIDPVFLAVLSAPDPHRLVRRQYPVPAGRIDFRIGGTNPVAVELVVRPPKGSSEIYGSQNGDELKKLSGLAQSQAKLRVLLLIDRRKQPIPEDSLKRTYKKRKRQSGSSAVQVIYVHTKDTYRFKW